MRRRLFVPALLFLLLVLPLPAALANTVYVPLAIGGPGVATPTATTTTDPNVGYCTYIVDGDTIDVDLSGITRRVRYIGIDTPEGGDCYYAEAKAQNSELVMGRLVRLVKDVSETDRYGRLLRYVYVDDLHVNAELVRLGYALASTYPPDVAHSQEFADLQHQAAEAGLGLWGGCTTPTPSATLTILATLTWTPWPTSTRTPTPTRTYTPWPTATQGTGGTVYITDTGEKYHRDGCRYLNDSKHAVSCSYAQSNGYTPCGVCDPVCP